jgi:hypothetical protein
LLPKAEEKAVVTTQAGEENLAVDKKRKFSGDDESR